MSSERTPTRILYNNACPVCSREINHYADLAQKDGLPLAFDDLNDPQRLSEWNMSRSEAAKRLYVQHGNEILSGVPAFIVIWQEIPRYRWLARLAGLPGIRQAAGFVYDRILAPVICAWDRRRLKRAGCASDTCTPDG